MSTVPQSEWQRVAAMRWPKADIVGDGCWCFLIECYSNRGARLFQNKADAIAAASKSCGCGGCSVWNHRLSKLELPKPSHYVPMADRFPDRYDKD
jgi:hypothetical protein